MEEKIKKVDESWKESVVKESKDIPHEADMPQIEANFSTFVTTLGIQVAIALGDIPNPMSEKKEIQLDQAKYLIDILDMLKEKTKNNLSPEEAQLLDNFLYEFHIKFVEQKKLNIGK